MKFFLTSLCRVTILLRLWERKPSNGKILRGKKTGEEKDYQQETTIENIDVNRLKLTPTQGKHDVLENIICLLLLAVKKYYFI